MAGPRTGRAAWIGLMAVVFSLLVGWLQPATAAADFLEPEKAFRFAAKPLDAANLEVTFLVAPGYYLYREQFKFTATGATLGTPTLPQGKVKFDETFQKNVETYRDTVRIVVPVSAAAGPVQLVVTSQGCADAGLCYPPMQSTAALSFVGLAAPAGTSATPGTAVGSVATGIEAVLQGGSFWPIVGAFFLAGLLLSLTPCVLPMLPIISSIIVGQSGQPAPALAIWAAGGLVGPGPAAASNAASVSRRRSLALAASYSFGMALVYTAFGVAAGLAGEGLAAALQNPWVLGAFALGLVALALSMFGFYNLQMPLAMRCRFSDAASKLPAGRVAGVCAMGGVSALIVSPCVAAPLAGALLYLSQTRDVVLGGTALFSLATGMSVPLLLVGASAGALLPRAGSWMVEVKAAFGVLLLGVALWTVQSVLPASLVVALWGILALGAAYMVFRRTRSVPGRHGWRHALAALLGTVGVLQIVGAATGGTDPVKPLAQFASRNDADRAGMPRFTVVRSVAELDSALRSTDRPVVLDFYADWCVSCKEMERFTFTNAEVQKKLAGALLLKVDVTANNDDDRALLRRFRLFGPPGMIFFDARGQEVVAARTVGFQGSMRFLETLSTAGL